MEITIKYLIWIVVLVSGNLTGQITLIPDPTFEQALIDLGIDSDGVINGQVATSDINTVVSLTVSDNSFPTLTDLTGIEDFTALEYLDCSFNDIENLDVSNNLNLKFLYCQQNNLSEIDVSNNIQLEELFCGIPSFDVHPPNFITSLDVSNNINLKFLSCGYLLMLDSLDLSNNLNLTFLDVVYCSLDELDISNNSQLQILWVGEVNSFVDGNSNNLESLDLSANSSLELLSVYKTGISSLNLKNGNNIILTQLDAVGNPDLFCIQVDDEVAGNNNEFPYSEWFVDAQITYFEDCSLGVSDIEFQPITYYPSPVRDVLYFKLANEDTIDSVTIYNSLGKLVIKEALTNNQVNLSSLSSGLYFVEIQVGQIKYRKKIIKK